MRIESWKAVHQAPPLPSAFLIKSVRELLEDVGVFIKSSAEKHKGNIEYVSRIGIEGSSSRGAKG